ncbi:MAG: hypothetical protein NW208_16370 [Bryobacter sp.]|nr:hypothetical protein [Bryobacter sp.]
MALNIPKKHSSAFAQLAKLDSAVFEAFLDRLQSRNQPCLHLHEMERRLTEDLSGANVTIESLGEALVAFALTAFEPWWGSEVQKSILISTSKEHQLTDEQAVTLDERLNRIAGLRFVQVSAKSAMLQVSHDLVFNSSRIATDLRPVFTEPLESNWAYLVIHQLRLSCRRNGEKEEIYIALDDHDLEELEQTILRARAKASLLRSSFKERQIEEVDGKS